MEDLDALLADLQNTTAHLNHSMKDGGTSSGGYGSVNTTTRTYTTEFSSPNHYQTSIENERQSQVSSLNRESPVYQNQRYIREVELNETLSETTTITTKQQRTATTPLYQPQQQQPQIQQQPQPQLQQQQQQQQQPQRTPPFQPSNMSSFNNNLSELDTLLEDLNSARYDFSDKKPSPSVNGPSNYHKNLSPGSSSVSSGGVQEVRPTVESLLDELQSAVPPGSSPPSYSPTVISVDKARVVTYTTVSPEPVTPVPTASSATKELDDLMASLSDFKINASQVAQPPSPTAPLDTSSSTTSPYAKPIKSRSPAPTGGAQPNQLDSMLGTLQSDMSRQGINTTQKGCCAACSKPIVGQVVTALAKTWHPEHFTCAHCNQELGTKNFFERDGKPYCENDYHNLFSPRCAYCNGPILDKCVTALDKTWHPEHFFCAQCGNPFGEDGFHEKDGKAYCRDDYFDMFAPKCGGCGRPIMENYISALNAQWHPDCFACKDCRQPFNGGSFFDHDGFPYCETHYHAKRGSLCAGCHKPITGRCITAMFRKFHPEHFVCSFCLKQLNKGTFKEQNDKPYCHPCFEKLFG